MPLKTAAALLALALVAPAFAQEPSPLEVAALTCIGPGYIPDGDPFEILDSLDERSCTKACKASAAGCRAVVKAIDQCGVNFLKASAKIGIHVCRGSGYTAAQCRGINDEVRADIDWWKAQGRIERAACDSDAETLCLSRCRSRVGVNYEDLVPAPMPEEPGEQSGATDTVYYLDWEAARQQDWEAARQQALLREIPEGEGLRVISQPGVGLTNGPIDSVQVQTDGSSGFVFLEAEHLSSFREIESSRVGERRRIAIEAPAE
ncbi:MAG: hypothetical protein JRE43_08760 [Deltaproteobacteria bacterium]|jgi:hypothetical protein|nr:hypothetical protein [Deltaproteobacteria bacterium]MBW2543595.1 hypothetical protein [Deltaproteobacteria bacterium]